MRRSPLWFILSPKRSRTRFCGSSFVGTEGKPYCGVLTTTGDADRRSSRLRYYYWAGAGTALSRRELLPIFRGKMLAKALRSAGRGAEARPVRLGGYILHQFRSNGGIKMRDKPLSLVLIVLSFAVFSLAGCMLRHDISGF